jgi:hypothetical protein
MTIESEGWDPVSQTSVLVRESRSIIRNVTERSLPGARQRLERSAELIRGSRAALSTREQEFPE